MPGRLGTERTGAGQTALPVGRTASVDYSPQVGFSPLIAQVVTWPQYALLVEVDAVVPKSECGEFTWPAHGRLPGEKTLQCSDDRFTRHTLVEGHGSQN